MTSPYQSLPPSMTPCVRCGVAVEAARADYTSDGETCCPACSARDDLAATEERAVTRMRAAGFANIGVGLLSWFLNPAFIVSASAIVTAVVVCRAVHGDWYRRRMGASRFAVSLAALTGGLIALSRFALPFIVAALR